MSLVVVVVRMTVVGRWLSGGGSQARMRENWETQAGEGEETFGSAEDERRRRGRGGQGKGEEHGLGEARWGKVGPGWGEAGQGLLSARFVGHGARMSCLRTGPLSGASSRRGGC